jgi:phosphoribosylformylglycinamidine cyclo-ligase
MGLTYKDAGVSIDAGNALVRAIGPLAKATSRPGADVALGGFGGFFDLKAAGYDDPLLVAANDGVGTKLKLAIDTGRHEGVGIDLVAMCANDLIVQGAEPLFFLDYYATGKLDNDVATAVVASIAEGCRQAGCALIGGETAEMPGFYPIDEYDLAGFAVGIVDQKQLITGDSLKPGDTLIGIASSGIHSNGYSLVRKVFSMTKEALDSYYESLGTTLGETLLTPTKIYVKTLKSLKTGGITVKACSHITGGGFYENIPRMLSEGTHAVVRKDSYEVPAIFHMLSTDGSIDEKIMYNTYNMGIGMVIAVDSNDADKAVRLIQAAGETAYMIGEIKAGEKGVTVC